MTFDFDAWHANYDHLTHQEHADIYSVLWRMYPVQRHFDEVACHYFLEDTRPKRVLEIGGWDGELACLMLAQHPRIEVWKNVEICREAREQSVCHDPRYRAQEEFDSPYDVLIMSHSAEHMRWYEVREVIQHAAPDAVYLAMPLPVDGHDPDWTGYDGSHILEVGWQVIDAYLTGRGFHSIVPRTDEVRCWST